MTEINQMAQRLSLNSINPPDPSDDDAYEILMKVRKLFKSILLQARIDETVLKSILTKFTDSGRRSAPWRDGSETGHRRPQDGADGNRQNRWLFDPAHEYYATKSMGSLVEIRFILQTLCMQNAPQLPSDTLKDSFNGILGHELLPGKFLEPLTKESPDFNEFVNDRRYIESGHVIPHARDGRHNYNNATLMLRDSNRQQADFTIDECVEKMKRILSNHGYNVENPS